MCVVGEGGSSRSFWVTSVGESVGGVEGAGAGAGAWTGAGAGSGSGASA